MLGDVLLITEKHQKAGEIIIERILANRKPKMMIGISGESGSGKSELAHVIAKGLRENGIQNVVGYGEYDWDTINRNIAEFKAGKISTGPCVDLVTEQVDQLTTDYSTVDMIIIDGLYAIKTEGIDLAVFIELTYHETKKAQVVRGKEPQNEYRMAVLEQEHKMVQALKPKADILINMDYEVEIVKSE